MTSSDDRWVAAELRESLSAGDLPALAEAGLLSGDDLQYLLSYKRSVPDAEDTDRYQELLMQAVSEKMNGAIEAGNLSVMSHATGVKSKRVDTSSWQAVTELVDLWNSDDRDDMLNMMVYAPLPPEGPTGVGKTDFAYTVIEAGMRAYPGLSVASNNTSDEFADVQAWSELEEWLEEQDGTKAFLLDEAAQVLQFADMRAGKALSKLIKLLRKYQCHLIVISHTGKDIPKDIRRMVLLCRKESKKKATIGVGLDEVNGDMQIDRELLKLGNIPPARLEYESIDDKGEFVFDMNDEDEAGASEDDGDESPDRVKCRGVNKEGESCGTLTDHESGFCEWHRDQWDGDNDPRFE
ncbi:ATP-binding protein [Halorussus sp. MSC15.2]|uniref:ATP-binding protein n=1 Tax=Halorussus sp. MSC15.2 TaxID=2283638 RepID=UPI0013D5E085|nr:ATP-binding protein [Halorussus sp. MSC15.2]NEU56267.1 ATP-binding protein [Halorussus sp. MSC15.2]